MRKILCLGGGGVRIYGCIGALLEGERQGFDFSQFDLITATSAGSIPGVLLAAGKTPTEIKDITLKMPLNKFINKGLIGEKIIFGGVSNNGLEAWINSLNLPPTNKLLINAFDVTTNTQKIFAKTDFEQKGYGYAVKCSTAMPGMINIIDNRYTDGGICEDPLMLNLNPDDKILCLYLGYPGEVKKVPNLVKLINPIERAYELTYALEYQGYTRFKFLIDKFTNLNIINPKVYNFKSFNFWIKKSDKIDMINAGQANTINQWQNLIQKWN